MKKIFKLSSPLFFLVLLLLSSCEKEYTLNTELSAPGSLLAPLDNAEVLIEPSSSATLDLEWEVSKAKDGGLILYEVLFDKSDGDFSQPVFQMMSDNKGANPKLSLDHKTLNKIASAAGIEALEKGDVKWTIVVSKGSNSTKASTSRIINLERPFGFAEIPTELYLVGTASEMETEGVKFKKKEDGVFEVYTSLKPGNYHVVSSKDAGARKYYVDGNLIKEGEQETSVSGTAKVYRLVFDFNSTTIQQDEIQKFELFMSAYNTAIGSLNYSNNGKWIGQSIPVEFYQFDWGRDERYKFRMTTDKGVEFWGSQNSSNAAAGTTLPYFYLVPVDNSQWDYTYKFNPLADRRNVKVEASFNGAETYTHKVTVL